MCNNLESLRTPLKLNLQMFAEPSADPADTQSTNQQTDQQTDQQADSQAADVKTYTEEDVQKLLKDELAKVNEQHKQALEAAKEETLKTAKMTADEKKKYELEKGLAELEKKEKELALRELKADTLKVLAEKELPADILDMVLADNLENTTKRIESFKAIFDQAVQKQVEKRLAGKSPETTAKTLTGTDQVREQFANALKGGIR